MQLVLDTNGLELRKKGKLFLIVNKEESHTISPGKIESIAITAEVLLSAGAIKLAIQNQIPILFFDFIGKAKARLWSPYFESLATLRRHQVKFAESTEASNWLMDLFDLKTTEQVKNLRYLKNRRPKNKTALDAAIKSIEQQARNFENYKDHYIEDTRSSIMGTEGAIARTYWQAIGSTLPMPYNFQKRSRRPAEDVFNAGINYLYGMLYTVVEGGLFAAGLDPYLGILHTDEHKRPTLAFDLIEAVRPWMDRLLIEQCLSGELDTAFFTSNQYGLFLNKKGKGFIIPLFNQHLRAKRRYLNQESTNKNHIYRLATLLARRIRTDNYLP